MSPRTAAAPAESRGFIELRDVSIRFRYDSVLRNINLAIQPNETVCIIGESGCGKTVMLKLIIGLLRPTTGKVFFDGGDLAGLDGKQLVKMRLRFGFLFQMAALFDSLTVFDNVAFGLREHRVCDEAQARQIVTQRLHEVGLPSEIETRKPAELSGGQRKRVGLARALAIGPEVMLYDEPTTGLDPIMSDVINELILQTQRTLKTTGVVVTHDMKTVSKVADRVIMLYPLARLEPDEPQVLYDGPPAELESSADPRVGQFVRGEAGERLREMWRLYAPRLPEEDGCGERGELCRHARTRVVMNERLMQFRIGMFVIVAGLVLTMMIVWFGESPSILRDQVFVKVRYDEAPGVLEGVPVRKSGIRIGEVSAIAFDERVNQPDGVLVTLAIERRYKLHDGAVARVGRSLIGDVTIDMKPGTSPALLKAGRSPADAPFIEGEVAPDPSKALEAATKIFDSAGDTLKSINQAASGIAKISDSAGKLEDFLASVAAAGKSVSKAADGISELVKANESNLQPALTDLREVAAKLNKTFDPETQAALKKGLDRFSSASARLDAGLAQLDPVLKDLGALVNHTPSTDIGQAVRRINVLAADLELLTSKLRDGRGGLNTDGTMQKLLTQAELHDNFNNVALSANQTLAQLRAVLADLRVFAEKVSRDPSAIGRGAAPNAVNDAILMKILKLAGKCVFATFFLVAGIGHFVSPDFFVKIMPPYLPFHRELVYLSGVFEIALGVLLLIPQTTRLAAWGLIALLVAVFPANIYMFQHQELFQVSPLLLLLRLPVQGILILWAWAYTRPITAGVQRQV